MVTLNICAWLLVPVAAQALWHKAASDGLEAALRRRSFDSGTGPGDFLVPRLQRRGGPFSLGGRKSSMEQPLLHGSDSTSRSSSGNMIDLDPLAGKGHSGDDKMIGSSLFHGQETGALGAASHEGSGGQDHLDRPRDLDQVYLSHILSKRKQHSKSIFQNTVFQKPLDQMGPETGRESSRKSRASSDRSGRKSPKQEPGEKPSSPRSHGSSDDDDDDDGDSYDKLFMKQKQYVEMIGDANLRAARLRPQIQGERERRLRDENIKPERADHKEYRDKVGSHVGTLDGQVKKLLTLHKEAIQTLHHFPGRSLGLDVARQFAREAKEIERKYLSVGALIAHSDVSRPLPSIRNV